MHAMDFYTSTCRCVMQANPENPATLSELRRLLPCLRQALGCYVCFNLLKDPMCPDHNVCRHSVCTNCLGGKMKLKPSCSWCKDYWDFVPNPLLKVLVSCYKKLCIYILNSPLGLTIKKETVNGEVNHLLKIITEGIEFSDSDSTWEQCVSVSDQPSCSTSTDVTQSTTLVDAGDDGKVPETDDIHVAIEEPMPLDDGNEITVSEKPSVSNVPKTLKTRTSKERFTRKRNLSKRTIQQKRNDSGVILKKTERRPSRFMRKPSSKKNPVKKVNKLKSSLSSRKTNNRKRTDLNPKVLKLDEPSRLEKIDNTEPALKKVKVELPPPDLKPLSLCNCGKSGNFNQLTCIGQRCPCYSMKLPCIGCKCRGCRNPKKGPDFQGMGAIGSSTVLRSGTRNTSEYMCVNM